MTSVANAVFAHATPVTDGFAIAIDEMQNNLPPKNNQFSAEAVKHYT